MAFLTVDALDNQVDLPVSAPSTLLDANNWLVVASFQLVSPIQFTLRWLQLELIDFVTDTAPITPVNGVCVFPSSTITLNNPDFGLAYVGLFRGFVPNVDPATQPLQEPPLTVGTINSVPPVFAIRNLTPTVYVTPDTYSFVLVNNTTNQDLRLTVTGQVRMTLNPGVSGS